MTGWLLLIAYLTVAMIVGAWLDASPLQVRRRFELPTISVVLIGALWPFVLLASATVLAFSAVLERTEYR